MVIPWTRRVLEYCSIITPLWLNCKSSRTNSFSNDISSKDFQLPFVFKTCSRDFQVIDSIVSQLESSSVDTSIAIQDPHDSRTRIPNNPALELCNISFQTDYRIRRTDKDWSHSLGLQLTCFFHCQLLCDVSTVVFHLQNPLKAIRMLRVCQDCFIFRYGKNGSLLSGSNWIRCSTNIFSWVFRDTLIDVEENVSEIMEGLVSRTYLQEFSVSEPFNFECWVRCWFDPAFKVSHVGFCQPQFLKRSHESRRTRRKLTFFSRFGRLSLHLMKDPFGVNGFSGYFFDDDQSNCRLCRTSLVRDSAHVLSRVLCKAVKNIKRQEPKVMEVLPTWSYWQFNTVLEPLDFKGVVIDRFNPRLKVRNMSFGNLDVIKRLNKSWSLILGFRSWSRFTWKVFHVLDSLETPRMLSVQEQGFISTNIQLHGRLGFSKVIYKFASISSTVFRNCLENIQTNKPEVMDGLEPRANSKRLAILEPENLEFGISYWFDSALKVSDLSFMDILVCESSQESRRTIEGIGDLLSIKPPSFF